MRLALGLCLFGAFALCGCGSEFYAIVPSTPSGPLTGVAVSGHVLSGTLPVVGAHVYLFAAGLSGYGGNSLSLLASGSTGTADEMGTYVLSGQDGSFTIPGYYNCTSTTEVYIYSAGGNSGLGENSSASELAALGTCPVLGTTFTPIIVNEVTTVAGAFALAGFATDAVHVSSSGTSLATMGVEHAFTNATNLASTTTGAALSEIPLGTATAPQETLDTLANIAAACIHSAGPSSISCRTLFTNVQSAGHAPTDTASAMIALAHNAADNVSALYALQTFSSPFIPALTTVPNDFTLAIVFTGSGGLSGVGGLAIDAEGNAWVVNTLTGVITEISSNGSFISGPTGYSAGLVYPGPIAIDTMGNAWIGNYTSYFAWYGSIVKLSSSGTVLSGQNGYTGGGIERPRGIAIDASGNVWVANPDTNSITELSNTGQSLAGSTGFTGAGLGFPVNVAIEPSGNVWIANLESFGLSELSASGQSLQGPTGLTAPDFYGGYDIAINSQGDVWASTQGGDPQVSKLSSTGAFLSPVGGYTGGGLGPRYGGGGAVSSAIDGTGNVWLPILNGNSVVELSNDGTVLSGSNGFENGISIFPLYLAIDGSGDVWTSNTLKISDTDSQDKITEMIGAASPVVTPLAAGVKTNMLGTRP